MSILTNWGYKLPDLNSLDSLLPEQNFDIATGGKYHGDTRVSSALITASQAVRDYVGWHLYPSAKCELDTTFFDRRVTRVNGDLLIQLPARYVSGVTEVLIGGEAATQFVLQPNGLLLVHACGFIRSPYTTVKVTYTAGLPDVLMPALQSVVGNRAIKSLSASNGVQSETAGGVSISYSSSWMSDASGAGLTPTEMHALAPYKVTGVF